MASTEVVIASPVRTPLGTYNGSLKDTAAVDLGAMVIREVMARSGLPSETIDSVIMGNVVQAGNKMNPARQSAINGGLPVSVPAWTVNRVCGSGAQAIITASHEILAGESSIVIAGGMENMDRAPYLMTGGRWGYRMGAAEIYDSMLSDGLEDAFSGKHSGWHTEDLVQQLGITREAQDEWAVRSQQRFSNARDAGNFVAEIVPITIKGKKKDFLFDTDETPRPDTSLSALSGLRPAFRSDGTITAGNSPGLNSGAAALIVADRTTAERSGLKLEARIVGSGVSAVEPGLFGLGPVPAALKALERAGWSIGDLERVEINEAYAAVPLAVMLKLGLPDDIVNVEGGAVSHGHPIGATGAVLVTRLIYSMRRDGLSKGLVTLCIGGGQGIAIAIEVI